ncbi:MAG: hypothetical protein KF752_04050 [Pirellulaceae bacterium]|nr:hypothetical protein [Pirellulaceae bacterium]
MTSAPNRLPALRPMIVGEVLFDCFDDVQVLGGAPFNVAWNLTGLGLQPLMVTAVGDDALGSEVVRRMQQWGMDRSGLQVLADKATGRVDIRVTNGQPSYQFWDDVAYDHIRSLDSLVDWNSIGLIYHGSLALRGATSRETIRHLRRQASCPVFVDVNIRMPHFDRSWIDPLLVGADHVKLNNDELHWLVSSLGSGSGHMAELDNAGQTDRVDERGGRCWNKFIDQAGVLQRQFGISNLWITAGELGAAWLGNDGQYCVQAASPVADLVDTVGAGDALSAVIIRGIMTRQSPQISLAQAVRFASRVCALRGAISTDPAVYNMDLTVHASDGPVRD